MFTSALVLSNFSFLFLEESILSNSDGMPYVLRRIEGFRLSNEHALKLGELWKQIRHPNIVGLTDIFVSKDFGGVPCMLQILCGGVINSLV